MEKEATPSTEGQGRGGSADPAGTLTRVFDVRRGEGRPLLQATLALHGIIAGHTLLETARDSLFLESLPPGRLPLVYLLSAAVGALIARLNPGWVRQVGHRNALVSSLVFATVGTTALHFQPRSVGLAYALYGWSVLVGTLAVIQFWLVAAQQFTVTQSKRLFPAIAAGGVLGGVIGAGLATAVLAAGAVLDLLLAAAGLFMLSAYVTSFVDEGDAAADSPATAATPGRGRAILRQEPYVRRLALLTVLGTASLLLTDYLFKSVAAAHIAGPSLGPFFARYYLILNTLALVFQVFIASRLVTRLGVVGALCVLPILLLTGGAAMLLAGGGLAIVLLAKGADGALRHSLHRIASELLFLPLSSELRARAKPLLDSMLLRLAQAATAGGILMAGSYGLDTPRWLAGALVLLSLGWATTAMSLRGPYLNIFRQNLARGLLQPGTRLQELDLRTAGVVIEGLSSTEEPQVLAAIELLSDADQSRLIPALILHHDAEAVLLRALRAVPDDTRTDWIPLTERLLTHPSSEVRVAAVRALGRHGRLPPIESLPSTDDALRAYAAFYGASTDDEHAPEAHPAIRACLADAGDPLATRRALLQAIAEEGDARWVDMVERLIDGPGGPVPVAEAAEAIARVPDRRFIPMLIRHLGTHGSRTPVRHALVACGAPALQGLSAALRAPETPRRVRLQIPLAISQFRSQPAAELLLSMLDDEDAEGRVRFKALRALGSLAQFPQLRFAPEKFDRHVDRNLREYLRMSALGAALGDMAKKAPPSLHLLRDLIDDKATQAEERVYRLLQLQHRNEDLGGVAIALRSRDPRRRANAVEFLDALSVGEEEERRALLRLMVDDLSPKERSARTGELLGSAPPSEDEALSSLMGDHDEALAALSAHHVSREGPEALSAQARAVLERATWLRADGGGAHA